MIPHEPTLVKLVCGVLYSDAERLEQTREKLIERYGPIDITGEPFEFDITDYYVPEMGTPIWRLFYSFEPLISPGDLAQIKIDCNQLEDEVAVDGQRRVNLDPGYLDYDKFVLASAKYAGHKIYLDHGIYADVTLNYAKGIYHPSPWCFPDFQSGRYNELFLKIRACYKGQLRKQHPQR